MTQAEFSSSNPIGNGPFEFDTWDSGTEARVGAYDDYYGESPSVDGVHFAVIESDSANYNYAMNRNTDIFELPTAQYDPGKVSVEEEDDQAVRSGPTASCVTARRPTTPVCRPSVCSTSDLTWPTCQSRSVRRSRTR